MSTFSPYHWGRCPRVGDANYGQKMTNISTTKNSIFSIVNSMDIMVVEGTGLTLNSNVLERGKTMKRSRILYFITIVLALVVLTSCGNIKVSKSSGDYAGMDYQEVSNELSKLGFKNISSEEIADLPSQGEVKDGTVESVTIGGEAFEAGGSFSKESEVYIVYHTIKTIPLPIGADEISGKDYKEIGQLLSDSGFTNIEIKEVDDIDPDGTATDSYNEMIVSGSADFKKGDTVPFDAAIGVYYHVPYEKFGVKINVDFLSNWFFDKYRVEFYVDDESIKTLDHGEDYAGEMRLRAGTHKLIFKKEEDESIEGEEDIEITSNSEVNITISCKTDYIEVTINDIYRESDVGENQIRINFTSSDYFGKDYKDVVSELKAMGFTNVTEQPLYDIELGITTEGSSDFVSINGSTDYNKGDIFEKDVAVIVPYHLNAEDDPNKPKETGDTSEAAVEETSAEETESGENTQQTKNTTFNSTNDKETAKLGNSGKFAYIKRLSNYDLFYLIDFDEGVVYNFHYEQGYVDGTVYSIDSGDLNNGLYAIYGEDEFTIVLHFHYVNNPDVLIEYLDGEETKYNAASIDDVLKIKEIYESNR